MDIMETVSVDGISQTNVLLPKNISHNVKQLKFEADIMEATCTKEIMSPKIYNQTATTNKFSNFGFFAGSPRATAMAGV